MDERMKRCSNCKQLLPFDDFGNMTRSRDGKQAWCKNCQNAKARERSARIKDLKPSTVTPRVINTIKKVEKFAEKLKESETTTEAYHKLGTTKDTRTAASSVNQFLGRITKDTDVMEHFISVLRNEHELADFLEYFDDARKFGDLSDRRDALKLKAKILGLFQETTKIIDERSGKPEEIEKKLEMIDNIIENKAFKKEGSNDEPVED